MKTSETIKEIAPALVKAIGSMGAAVKDGKNPHFKSSYATLASAVEASREALLSNGICAMQDQGGITEHNTVILTTRLLHTSGEWIDTVCEAKPKSFTPQDIGSSITYLRRYGLMAALGMPPEDDDGNKGSQGEQQADIKSTKRSAGKGPAQRALYAELQKEVDACGKDLDCLTILGESEEFKCRIGQLSDDWQNDIRARWKDAKVTALSNQPKELEAAE